MSWSEEEEATIPPLSAPPHARRTCSTLRSSAPQQFRLTEIENIFLSYSEVTQPFLIVSHVKPGINKLI